MTNRAEYLAQITGITHQGAGVGRLDQLAVFVPGALPGELVRIAPVRKKKNYLEARLLEVVQAVPARREPACPLAATCGGCQLQHCAYPEQLVLKQQLVKGALTRIAHMEQAPVAPTLPSPEQFHYRNRCQLQAAWQGDELLLGFFAPHSYRIQSLRQCLLLAEPLNAVLANLAEWLAPWQEALSTLEQVHLRCCDQGVAVALTVAEREGKRLAPLAQALQQAFPAVCSVAACGLDKAPYWRHLSGAEQLTATISGLRFTHGQGSFLQVNTAQAQSLYASVLELAALTGQEAVVDLYCGVGTISLLLAQQAAAVIGVEEFAPAVGQARLNAQANGLANCEFVTGKAETVFPQLLAAGRRPQLLVVDPPRGGCAPPVLEAARALACPRIIYVSCDPATLARDLRLLPDYQVQAVQPVDMFPQTGHVECVVLMSRNK